MPAWDYAHELSVCGDSPTGLVHPHQALRSSSPVGANSMSAFRYICSSNRRQTQYVSGDEACTTGDVLSCLS
jgi:hypothetical protein